MSEKAPLMFTEDSSKSKKGLSVLRRGVERVEDGIELFKVYYAKAISKIHARHFLAEFLGTFILVVSWY